MPVKLKNVDCDSYVPPLQSNVTVKVVARVFNTAFESDATLSFSRYRWNFATDVVNSDMELRADWNWDESYELSPNNITS